jgi:hypothetical protein
VAIHTHHDAMKRMPLASSETWGNSVGTNTAPRAGYSWLVPLLPFMEEQALFDRIAFISDQFSKAAFNAIITESPATDAYHVCAVRIQSIQCPSYGGPEETPNPPYLRTGPVGQERNAAVGNYVAIVSSYMNQTMKAVPPAHIGGGLVGNGAMPFPQTTKNVGQGLNFKAITDGMSKTVFLTEGKEERFGNWYCGQSAWVVGGWVHSQAQPMPAGMSMAPDGFLGWGAMGLLNPLNRTALNVGGIENSVQINYMDAGTWVGAANRREWGPSSDHTGNIVVHLFGDGHVTRIVSTDIDKNVYLRLISRNGCEPLPPIE